MTIYHTICGKTVRKSGASDTIGFRETEDCAGCPFLLPYGPFKWDNDKKHSFRDIQGYECRMPQSDIEYRTRFSGNLDDKCTCSIASLDFSFLTVVSNWINDTYPDGEIRGSFSVDTMELEFDYREKKQEPEKATGWECQRDALERKPAQAPEAPMPQHGRKLTDEILHHAKYLEQGISEDDELETITELAALTALSFAGVYLLLDAIAHTDYNKIDDDNLNDYIEELKQEPENCMGYEDEQEQFGFDMTMM